jgi:hypothetical protein
MILFCSNRVATIPGEENPMRRSTRLAACALFAATLWQLPAAAQQAAPAAASATSAITFDQYRDFRLRIVAERQATLAKRLAAPELTAPQKASLQRQKDYYDWQAAMPAAERDRMFKSRFARIDTDRDGRLDVAELAAWRLKQHAYYRQLALDRAHAAAPQQ